VTETTDNSAYDIELNMYVT